ncbi:endonuclease/exonuclease/phosphatase family protein [Nonlabens marinus]|uniref:Endonuclease/exonuclease/phosphatase domain-containing protein n=1 Tax=Nonlabens marinus S1-08 TaxID=1454201 RepID=W8VS65_9FLAO|nr:endonuclease/exonuclease/phosphatase family protein [Nonlabens marinus]BAO56045.1 hypothetical protein NMS_2036 [Nonlabens marinus S1-08]
MNKSIVQKSLWIATIAIVVASILPNIAADYWLIDIFSNFKFQYLTLSIVLLISCFFLIKRRIVLLVLLSSAVLWNGYFIAPYYFQSNTTELPSHKKVKFTSINLHSSNSEKELVLQYITEDDPDVLILMEFTPTWQDALEPIMEAYPYRKLMPRNDNFGITVWSKYKMQGTADYFELNSKPSIIANLLIENISMSLIATHPIPPISQQTFENRNTHLSNILENRATYSDHLIIAGDFNTSSFSNHFRKLTRGDLKDSRLGFGLLPTWPANYLLFQTTLDHFLVSKNITVLERSTGKNIGSDHLPISLTVGIH